MKKILSGPELYNQLCAVDWKDLLPKLHYYALNKLERFPALAEMYDLPGLSTQIADKAVELLWEEKRKWNVDYYATVYDFLKGIVDSMVYNYVKSKEVVTTETLPDLDHIELLYGLSPNPEELFIVREIEAEIAEILKTDPDAAKVVNCLIDGLKPREIADELNLEVKYIYNIIKRIQRKLKVFTNSK